MGIKYEVNEKFFEKWTHKMSYVLGYIYADGSLEDSPKIRGKYLRISSIDKVTIERIKMWLNSEHSIVEEKSQWKNGNTKHLLRIGNKNLYSSLLEKGLYPGKSLTVTLPKIPKKYAMSFIRGYFDGDGCVYVYYVKGKKNVVYARKLSVIFTSGSKNFLESLSSLLTETCAVRSRRILNNTRSFQLRYSTNDSIKIYKQLYKTTKKGDYLERKHQKFRDYFAARKMTQWRSR